MRKSYVPLTVGLLLALGSAVRAGDVSIGIFSESGGTDPITTSAFTHDWDTTVRNDASAYTLIDSNGIQLDAGHYLVMYSSRFDSTDGSNRSEIQSSLSVNDSALPIGWSQGSMRRSDGADEAVTSGGGIISAAQDDVLQLISQRTDVNGAGVQREPDATGIQLLKLSENWDYLSLSSATNQSVSGTAWTDVVYDAQHEVEAGSFEHNGNSADITLKKPGHYLVFANTYLTRDNNNTRSNYSQRLTLDGAEVTGSLTTVYVRGNQNGENANDGAAAIGMIVETTAADSLLNVEIRTDTGLDPTINANKTGVTIVKLPDTADYIRLTDTSQPNINQSSVTAVPWNTDLELDFFGFTHLGSQVGAVAADDYLFLTAMWDNDTGGVQRSVPHVRWRDSDGTIYPYGQTTFYDRATQGSDEAGNWAGLLVGLDAGAYVEVVSQGIAKSGTQTADSMGLQGIRLSSLFLTSLAWSGADPAAWMSDQWDGGVPTGGEAHLVSSGKVEVQSDPPAADRLILEGGAVEVQSGNTLEVSAGVALNGGTLDVIGQLESGVVVVGPGGTLDLTGAMNVGALAAGGTMNIAPTASIGVGVAMTVDGTAVDMGGGSLTLQPGAILAVENAGGLDMNGGTLTADGAGVFIGNDATSGDTAALTVDNALTVSTLVLRNGGALNHQNNNVTVTDALALSGSDLDMTGGAVLNAATADVSIASGLTVDQGAVALGSLDVSQYGTLDTSGDHDVTLTGSLTLPDSQFAHTGSGDFTAAWNDATSRPTKLTLNGGDLTASIAEAMYYSFDDPCDPYNDGAPGGTHDGAVSGTAPTWLAGGYDGGGVAFDGNQNGLAPLDAGFMKKEKQALSFGMWIEQDANTAGLQMLLDEGGSTNGLALVVENGLLQGRVRTSGTPDVYVSDDANLSDGWHHVGLVFGRTPGLFELYLDGALIDSNTFGLDTISQHTDDPGIGFLNNSGPWTSADRYRGLLDELVYFDRAVDADEMLAASLGAPRIDLKDLDIDVQSDSNMAIATPLNLGTLTLNGDRTLGLSGSPVSFGQAVLNGASAVTIRNDNEVLLTRDADMDFGGADATLTKAGAGTLVLTRPLVNLGAGASKVSVQDGALALSKDGLLGAVSLELAGGAVLLSSPAGSATQTYNFPIALNGDGAILAGKAVDGSEDAATVTYISVVTVPAGQTLGLGTLDGYTLNMATPISGGDVRVTDGNVLLNGGATLGGLEVSGGGKLTLGADVNLTNLTVSNDSLHAGENNVNVAESGVMKLDQSTYTATVGGFAVTGDVSQSGAETLILGGPGSVLTVASPAPTTLTGTSIGNDTNTDFPDGGSLVVDPVGNPTYSVTASGSDIWGSSDGLYFAYKEFDAADTIDISARVNGFSGGDNVWRKAGLMIRSSLDPNARNGFMLIAASDNNGLNAQLRPSDAVGTLGSDQGTGTRTAYDTPVYLRITYAGDGNTFNMYWRDNEFDPWTLQGTNTLDVDLAGPIYAGLAVTSHNTGQQTTVPFDTLAGDFDFTGTPLTRIRGTVTGEGTIAGNIVMAGTLSPGASLGTILTDAILFEDGSAFVADIGADASDLVAITGDLVIDPGAALEIVQLEDPALPEYTLMTWTGQRTGEFVPPGDLPVDWQLIYDTNALRVVVPEPTTLALVGLGLVGALLRRRRRA